MDNLNHTPVYNLKAVLKETGLKADVLRAWERRYDLPKPQRTSGGHRLYSEYDVATIKWLKSRQAEGLSISRAVELWNEVLEAGSNPLVEYHLESTSSIMRSVPVEGSRIEIFRQDWLTATMAFDSIRADEILNQAFAIFPVETVCTDILQKGIADIGNDWYLGKASVQQEHFAIALASRRLQMLITLTPPPTRRQSVLLACPPGEWHAFPVLMLSLLLARRGLKVIYLGANVPISQMEETVQWVKPDLFVLAAQQLTTAATLRTVVAVLQGQGVLLTYGGLVFNRIPKLRERIPAYYLGESMDSALDTVERLLSAPIAPLSGIDQELRFQELDRLFIEKRALVEHQVLAEMQQIGLNTEYLREATAFFGNEISAALALGDLTLIETDLEWVRELLSGRQASAQHLSPYLQAYAGALDKVIGQVSAPVTAWMNAYLLQNEA